MSYSSSSPSSSHQEIYVCRFILDGNKKFYLRSLWGNDHFSLYVTDGRYLWLGEASASFIESNMLIRGLEMDNFIKRSKGALISQDKKYTYKVTQGVKLTDLEFTWFFRLGQTDIMARCMLPLGRVSDGQQAQKAMQNILDFFVDRRNYLERQNNDLSELNKSLKTQRGDALGQFSKLVEDKKSLESELYKKFVLVLNEKKQKIRELKDALEHAQNARIERSHQQEEEEDNKSEESDISPYRKRSKHRKRDKNDSPNNKNKNNTSPSSHATSSITFNVNDKVTPSLDLLDSSDIVVTTTVRKRHRPNDKSQPSGSDKPSSSSSSSSNNNTTNNHLTSHTSQHHSNNTNNNTNNKNNNIFATPTKKPRPLLYENGNKVASPFTPNRRRRRGLDNDTTDANDLIDELI